MAKNFVTKESLCRLKDELIYLREVRRKEIAERIKIAKEQGDLSENAEYAQAKEEQGFIEGRIAELEEKIKGAVVIDDRHKNSDVATIGSTIRVKLGDNESSFTIVGSSDVDPQKGFISNESPIGRALLGKRIGDLVEVDTPGGLDKYKVLSVS